MKAFKIIFTLCGIMAAVAVATGAYWHIYTLAGCGFMAWVAGMDKTK